MNTGFACWNWGLNYDIPTLLEDGENSQADSGYAGRVLCGGTDHGRTVSGTSGDDLSEFDNWLYGFEKNRNSC